MSENTWARLDPNWILDTIEGYLGKSLSSLCLPRNSYVNRVFELELADKSERLILKVYRPNRWTKEMILEEHDFLHYLYDKELPVIPPLKIKGETLHVEDGMHLSLFPKKGGRALDEFNRELWEELGRLLGRFHAASEHYKVRTRVLWSLDSVTKAQLETLKKARVLPPDYEAVFFGVGEQLISKYTKRFDEASMMALHGDCHIGNLMIRPEESMYLVDFDDMSKGPAIQDLWLLFPENMEDCERELGWFKEGYTVFRDFPTKELPLVPVLRAMRQIHFAAWCAIQKEDPHFQNHFPDWGSIRYWNELVKDLQSIVYS